MLISVYGSHKDAAYSSLGRTMEEYALDLISPV